MFVLSQPSLHLVVASLNFAFEEEDLEVALKVDLKDLEATFLVDLAATFMVDLTATFRVDLAAA